MKIKKVLVSQPKPASEKSPYYDIAEKYGVKIDFRPFIKVESLSAKEFRQQKVSILDHTAVIFTSRHAIDHFFHLCTELRVTIPETMKYFCVTEAIALYIQKYVQYRKRKIFFGNTGKFDDLLPSIVKHKTEKYLVPMSDVHTEEIKNLLDKSKIQHTEVVMYRTVSNDFTPDEKFDYDMLVFFSPAGVSSLKKNFPDFEQKEIKIGTFGSTTAQAVRDAGLRLDLEAPSVQAPSMTAALRHEGIATEFRMRGGTSDVQGVVFARNGYPFNGSKIDRQFSFSKIDHALSLNRRQALSANERGSVSNPVASFSHLLEDLLQPVYDADEERRLQERLRKKRKQHRL